MGPIPFQSFFFILCPDSQFFFCHALPPCNPETKGSIEHKPEFPKQNKYFPFINEWISVVLLW